MQRDFTRLLTREQVANRIAYSPYTIDRWVKLKLVGFPLPIKVGPQREHRWKAADIELWIDRQSRHPALKRLRGALAQQVRP